MFKSRVSFLPAHALVLPDNPFSVSLFHSEYVHANRHNYIYVAFYERFHTLVILCHSRVLTLYKSQGDGGMGFPH